MIVKHIHVRKTARYFLSSAINEHTKHLIFLLHGYAHTATEMLETCRPVANVETVLIAPDALHRFYAKGFGGKPVGSWMTRDDRETEISDYVNYLDEVYALNVPAEFKGTISVIGFSQGVATASRWVAHSSYRFDKLIHCSGSMGAELTDPIHKRLMSIEHVYISGNADSFVDDELHKRLHKLFQILRGKILTFEGGHTLDLPTIKSALI